MDYKIKHDLRNLVIEDYEHNLIKSDLGKLGKMPPLEPSKDFKAETEEEPILKERRLAIQNSSPPFKYLMIDYAADPKIYGLSIEINREIFISTKHGLEIYTENL